MRYFYLTILILCLGAVQESFVSSVKPTHPIRHGDKTNEHEYGHRKPQGEMRHFQNEKGKHVTDEKLKEGRHMKDDKEKEGRHVKNDNVKHLRHVKDGQPNDARHAKGEKLKEGRHQDDNVKQGRHVKDEKFKEPRHAKDEKFKEGRHQDDNVKQGRHVKDEKFKEGRHTKDDKIDHGKQVKDGNIKQGRHVKEESHAKDGILKEGRHTKDKKIKEGRHIKDENKKQGRHGKDEKLKERNHVKDNKLKLPTSQNITRKHPKGNVTKPMQRYKIGPGVPVINLLNKILLKKKARVGGKHLRGNHTSLKRKHKKSKDNNSKPGFRAEDDTSTDTTSSSDEELWPEEWDDYWLNKKMEALNTTKARGDVINMAGARPWAFPCGDPGQHDLPWGTCMLAPECDAEYRIYRGDSFCGRTSLVCCALQLSNYDFYHGIDISFGASSYSTTSSDEDMIILGPKERKERQERKAREKRKQERAKRKDRLEKSIKKIVKEVKDILSRAFKNGTMERKKQVDRIREYIKKMKKQYREDRKNLINMHHAEMKVNDEKLQIKLNQIRGLNLAFMTNATFRDIIVNGTVNKEKLIKLLREHPELTQYFQNRRSGGGGPYLGPVQEATDEDQHEHAYEHEYEQEHEREHVRKRKVMDANTKSQEYDVEYGVLYY